MRVLVVTSSSPHPEGSAAGRCAIGLLAGLRAHDVEVTCVSPRRAWDPPDSPLAGVGVDLVDVPHIDRPWGSRQVRRVRQPHDGLGHPAFREAVAARAAEADVVHLDEVESTWAIDDHPLTALHVHYRARLDQRLGAPWRGRFREVGEFALLERAAVRRHHHLIANTPEVAATLRREAADASVAVMPLSLDPSGYPRAPLDGPPVAGVIGTAAWAPTRRGLERLVRHVWPTVRGQVPAARLQVAGRGVDAVFGGAVPAGVDVLGPVPSSAAFLTGLSVLVFPLDRGSGMKVKVLEALAVGVPVVTTPAGAEGFAASDGIVVATSDREVATATASLLADAGERRARGRAAAELFADRYAPEQATAGLVARYRDLVDRSCTAR
jgi:polysaccharide biosynthesis protein PslH